MPVLQPVSDTASCGPRHVMLLLSLWASSQFLKQTLSTFRRAVRGSRRRGGAGRSAQLFRSSSPSFCVPLIQPRGERRVTWYAARCEDFLQEPSFVSCLWESQCSGSVLLDGKGSGVAHLFHNHRLFLVLCYCRIFFGLMFAQALGTKICHFVSLIVQL